MSVAIDYAEIVRRIVVTAHPRRIILSGAGGGTRRVRTATWTFW
jgi:hypothetical protein